MLEAGETYQGEFFQGLKHGFGEWRKFNSKFSYIGMWSNNLPEGYGKMTMENGDSFEGHFRLGLKHGSGIEHFSNGGSFTGIYKNGQPNGVGQLILADGTRYEGFLKQGIFDGKGQFHASLNPDLKFTNKLGGYVTAGKGSSENVPGSKYSGHFKDGLYHGEGRLELPNGTVYEGGFYAGKKQGHGHWTIPSAMDIDKRTLIKADISGDLAGDALEGKGRTSWGGVVQYTGEFRNNRRHGRGVLV